jgi:hypothetical protein
MRRNRFRLALTTLREMEMRAGEVLVLNLLAAQVLLHAGGPGKRKDESRKMKWGRFSAFRFLLSAFPRWAWPCGLSGLPILISKCNR